MDKIYDDLFQYLNNVDSLKQEDYNKLVSLYGSSVVNNIIEEIIERDNSKICKFSVYVDNFVNNDSSFLDMTILNIYINDISSLPRLSDEENFKYTSEAYEIVKDLKSIFSLLDGNYVRKKGNMYSSIVDIAEYYLNIYKDSDKELCDKITKLYERFIYVRNLIVEGNIRLVISAMRPYYREDGSFVEILQHGNLGLMRAVEKYDPNFGTSFSTYAYYWIKQAYRNSYKHSVNVGVYVSYKTMEANFARLKTYDRLTIELGRYPTNEEVADRMGITIKKLEDIENASRCDISLNSKVNFTPDNYNECELMDLCCDHDVNVEEEVCSKELYPELMKALDEHLTERQKFIILNRFGFSGDVLTYEQLGDMFGISKQWVEQEQVRSLKKLRKKAKDKLSYFLN